jgi:hypothetical protein
LGSTASEEGDEDDEDAQNEQDDHGAAVHREVDGDLGPIQ